MEEITWTGLITVATVFVVIAGVNEYRRWRWKQRMDRILRGWEDKDGNTD